MCTTERYGRNTFRIDYSEAPKRPTLEETVNFLFEVLETGVDVKMVQRNTAQSAVYVTMPTLERAESIVKEHSGKHCITHEGKQYPIPIEMVDGATEVNIRDLPPGIPDENVSAELNRFGEVLTIVPGVWGAGTRLARIPSGVRIVRMKLAKPIPSFITVCGEMTGVLYRGQQQTCRHCNEALHHGISCIQNRVGQLLNSGAAKSYASTVKQAPAQTSDANTASTSTAGTNTTGRRKGKAKITSLTNTTKPPASTASKVANRLVIPIEPLTLAPPSSPKRSVKASGEKPEEKMRAAVGAVATHVENDDAPTFTAPAADDAAAAATINAAVSAAIADAAAATDAATDANDAAASEPMRVECRAPSGALMFKEPLAIPSTSFSIPSHDEPLAVKRKQNAETDNESDASCSSTFSVMSASKRKPGRPPKKHTTSLQIN
ncbi:uncharacterized protein LOC133395092 [Anopheles gambiae]|uniref:uncharacterized protein LOC133395092 n=1 Tax=Anopheles gambiae TaxID=7165 RepID=UPI002AC8ED5C|nr:uncharacterized protein LOC133395092 [Anopheles gambiae]